jgi:hypothetical protein
MSYWWSILRTRPIARTPGRSLPAFIHNGSFHLSTINVYADGAIDCWGFVDRKLFKRKVASGWVATMPPIGSTISVFNLGDVVVADSKWTLTQKELLIDVEAAIRELNPLLEGLIDMKGSETELRDGMRYAKLGLADTKPYRIGEGGRVVLASQFPVFVAKDDGYRLTYWFVYEDRQAQLGHDGVLTSVDGIAGMLEDGCVTTSVPPGAMVAVDGLGSFHAGESWWYVRPEERIREAFDEIEKLQGSPGAIRICVEQHRTYESDPTPDQRELLRQAYEAVPEHLRVYCGDMDSKDGRIRWILYGQGGTAI